MVGWITNGEDSEKKSNVRKEAHPYNSGCQKVRKAKLLLKTR